MLYPLSYEGDWGASVSNPASSDVIRLVSQNFRNYFLIHGESVV